MRSITNYACFLVLVLTAVGCDSEDTVRTPPSHTPIVVQSTLAIGVTLETVTPIRSTPIAIFTPDSPTDIVKPTEVPTPIYYTIAAGDTLYDIALSQNTNVDELLRLNPDLDPELLPVGWQLILPPVDQPSGPPTPVEDISTVAQIVGINLYDSTTGGLFLFGEVENRGDLALENIQVEIILQDKLTGGHEVVRFWVEPGIVPPGTKAPFGHFLSNPFSDTELNQAYIITGNNVVDLGNRYLDLAAENAGIRIDDGSDIISGQILNTGDQTANGITLVASLYDEQQALTGYYQLLVDEPLSPGASRPFEIYILTPGNQVVSFELILQGLVETSS